MSTSVFPLISWTLRRSLGQACRGRGADTNTHTYVQLGTAEHRTRLGLHKQRLPVPEWDVRPLREALGSGEQEGDVGLNTVTDTVSHDLRAVYLHGPHFAAAICLSQLFCLSMRFVLKL